MSITNIIIFTIIILVIININMKSKLFNNNILNHNFLKLLKKEQYDKLIDLYNKSNRLYNQLLLKENNSNWNQYFIKSFDDISKIDYSYHKSILVNDYKYSIQTLLEYLESIIFLLPNNINYLDYYYDFNKNLNNYFYNNYQNVLNIYNINDVLTYYNTFKKNNNQFINI